MTVWLALFAALLQLFHIPAAMRQCMTDHRDAIVASIGEAETAGVPAAVMLAVGFLESHNGCDPNSGGNWGAPDHNNRIGGGRAPHAASALLLGHRACPRRGWLGAVSFFRCGACACDPSRIVGYTPGYALGVVRRLHSAAGLPPLDGI